MSVTVRRVRDDVDLRAALAVREEVFVHEQGVTLDEELDGLDEAPGTLHVLAVAADGTAVGTARVLPGPLLVANSSGNERAAGTDGAAGTDPASGAATPGVVHVGRVAVRGAGRGLGVGRALMDAVEELALVEHGVPDGGGRTVRVELSAQESAIPFYRRLGYEVADGRYLDARIWHRDAQKILTR